MRILTALTALTLLLLPVSAGAQYLTPEEAISLFGGSTSSSAGVPRNARAAQEAAARQEAQRGTLEHPTVTEWWTVSSSSAASEASAPVLDTTATDDSTTEETDQSIPSNLDPITQRLLLRLQHNPSLSLDTDDTLHSTAMHSGAPLAGTGPAQTATVVILMGAVGWTLWKARKLRGEVR